MSVVSESPADRNERATAIASARSDRRHEQRQRGEIEPLIADVADGQAEQQEGSRIATRSRASRREIRRANDRSRRRRAAERTRTLGSHSAFTNAPLRRLDSASGARIARLPNGLTSSASALRRARIQRVDEEHRQQRREQRRRMDVDPDDREQRVDESSADRLQPIRRAEELPVAISDQQRGGGRWANAEAIETAGEGDAGEERGHAFLVCDATRNRSRRSPRRASR